MTPHHRQWSLRAEITARSSENGAKAARHWYDTEMIRYWSSFSWNNITESIRMAMAVNLSHFPPKISAADDRTTRHHDLMITRNHSKDDRSRKLLFHATLLWLTIITVFVPNPRRPYPRLHRTAKRQPRLITCAQNRTDFMKLIPIDKVELSPRFTHVRSL
jgi:hypothetical protein